MKKVALAVCGAFTSFALVACNAPSAEVEQEEEVVQTIQSNVIEIATFKLADGVTPEAFLPLDEAVEREHVSKQPGFVSRETAFDEEAGWLVIVHWASLDDAEASMASFENAPAAAEFMGSLDASTMTMTRFSINQ